MHSWPEVAIKHTHINANASNHEKADAVDHNNESVGR